MKAYTSIEQSKKLAEILPIESADMYYPYVLPKSDKIKHNPEIGNPINALEWYNKGYTTSGKEPITLDEYSVPCWSLAALLNYLHEVDFFPSIEHDEHGVTLSVCYYDEEKGVLLSPVHNITTEADNYVDAYYEMILKLHEQKLL